MDLSFNPVESWCRDHEKRHLFAFCFYALRIFRLLSSSFVFLPILSLLQPSFVYIFLLFFFQTHLFPYLLTNDSQCNILFIYPLNRLYLSFLITFWVKWDKIILSVAKRFSFPISYIYMLLINIVNILSTSPLICISLGVTCSCNNMLLNRICGSALQLSSYLV